MDESKLTIIRAVRDMARQDGTLHRNERKVLRLIAAAEELDQEEKSCLKSSSEPIAISELTALLPERESQLKLLELSVLVSMADGVESPNELDRLRELTAVFGFGQKEVSGVLERARDRFFALTRLWEREEVRE